MQCSEQQEQHARDEKRGAGQHNTEEGEHRASEQQYKPPAPPRGSRESHYPADAGSCIRADVRGRIVDCTEHQAPPSCREPEALPRTYSFSCLQDNRLTMTGTAECRASGAAAHLVGQLFARDSVLFAELLELFQ